MLEKLELDDEGKGLHLCSVLLAYFISYASLWSMNKFNFHLFSCLLNVVFCMGFGEK